jgi:exopolysaccharide biosynthesis polyprenyl glycosylphosphotransferase
MRTIKHDLSLRIVKFLPILLVTIPFALCWYLFFADNIITPFFNKGNWAIIALFVIFYVTLARIYDGFTISLYKISEMAYSQCLAVLVADGIMFIILWLLNHVFPNIVPCLVTLLVQMLLVSLWAWGAQKWYYRTFPPAKTALVYGRSQNLATMIQAYQLGKKFDIQMAKPVSEWLENLELLDGYEAAFIYGVPSHERNVILKYCMLRDISVYFLPRIGDIILGGARRLHMFHLPVFRVDRWNPHPEYKFVKRLFDVVLSVLILVLTSPVMLVTALIIKATDGGPVFYKQNRLTKDGKIFRLIKFRSMRVDAEKDGVARLSTGDKDDRITPVGRFIRKVRIDELPQLLNILSGSMSIVGPRPERPEIAAQYEETLPEFHLRLQVKAGLTGYAQVFGKYNTTPYDKLQMDLMYIANPSFVEDLKILFATVKILFQPESTDGVAEGQTTAEEEKEPVSAGK